MANHLTEGTQSDIIDNLRHIQEEIKGAPCSRAEELKQCRCRETGLWLMAMVPGLLAVILKVIKGVRMGVGGWQGLLFITREDLLWFPVATFLWWAVVRSLRNVGKGWWARGVIWAGGVFCWLSVMVLIIEHHFFATTGTFLDGELLIFGLGHLGELWQVFTAEVSPAAIILLPLVSLGVLAVAWKGSLFVFLTILRVSGFSRKLFWGAGATLAGVVVLLFLMPRWGMFHDFHLQSSIAPLERSVVPGMVSELGERVFSGITGWRAAPESRKSSRKSGEDMAARLSPVRGGGAGQSTSMEEDELYNVTDKSFRWVLPSGTGATEGEGESETRGNRGTQPPNIVLIFLESFGLHATSAGNPQLDTTPFLAGLYEKGRVVEQAYSQVPHTSKALYSAICGYPPHLEQTVTEAQAGAANETCLPHLLNGLNYATGYFQTAIPAFEDRRQLVKNFGYQTFFSGEDIPDDGTFERCNYFGYEDLAMLEPSMEWVREQSEQGKPFFATYLTLVSHHDYTTPQWFERRPYKKVSKTQANYLNALRYVDLFTERLYQAYEQAGLLSNTVFILVGDHGEGFGEHHRYQHDNVIYEEGLRVPMVLVGPRALVPPGVSRGPRQTIDILPTVGHILGVQVEGDTKPLGFSVFEPVPADRRLFFSCWYRNRCMAVLEDPMKYIYHYDRQPTEVFNLSTDPGEKINLVGGRGPGSHLASAEYVEEMEGVMLEWKARVNRRHRAIGDRAVRQAITTEPPVPAHPLGVLFGDGQVGLIGYDLRRSVIGPGEALEFTVYYQSNKRLRGGWKPFIHVTSRGGLHRMINGDHHPVGGEYPISKWRPGEYVADRVVIPLPPTYPEDTVDVWTGLFKGRQGLPAGGDLGGLTVDGRGRLRLFSVEVRADRPPPRPRVQD